MVKYMGIHRSKKIRTTGPADKDMLPLGGIKIIDENLSQEELIHKIENLSSKLKCLSNHGDEDSEGEINKTQDTLYLAMKAALNKGWLTRNQADGYLKPSEEYISQTDRRVKRKKNSDLVDIFSGDENQDD
ncbi:MAG: hypothetical protein ACLQBC_10350 [Syntrophales bacterium]